MQIGNVNFKLNENAIEKKIAINSNVYDIKFKKDSFFERYLSSWLKKKPVIVRISLSSEVSFGSNKFYYFFSVLEHSIVMKPVMDFIISQKIFFFI